MLQSISFKNIKKGFLLLLVASLASCNDDVGPDPIWDEDSAIRIEAAKQELRDLLTSSEHGWKMTYFTDDATYTGDDQELGGWTFVFNFISDNRVIMASDFSAATTTPEESEYDILLGSTIKVSFTTKNHIHLLSDSNNFPTPGLRGRGYKGDFEFLFYGKAEGSDDLIFRSNRQQIEIRFQRATPQDWDDLSVMRQVANLLDGALKLEINNAGNTNTYGMTFSPATRLSTVNMGSSIERYGIAYKPNGVLLAPGVEVDGDYAVDFNYDPANSWFISELPGNKTVKILIEAPDPTAHLFEQGQVYTFQHLQMLIDESSNEFFEIYVPVMDDVADETGLDLRGFWIVRSGAGVGQIQYFLTDENEDRHDVTRGMSYTVDTPNDRVILSGAGSWSDPSFEALLKPVDDVIINGEGFRIVETGISSGGNPVFRFRLYDNSDIEYGVLRQQ